MTTIVQRIEAAVPGENVPAYQEYCAKWFAFYEPAGDFERRLVQIIADTSWRLARVWQWAIELGGNARELREISRWEVRLNKHLTRVREKLDKLQDQRRNEFETMAIDTRRPN